MKRFMPLVVARNLVRANLGGWRPACPVKRGPGHAILFGKGAQEA